MSEEIFTVGHSNHPAEFFTGLLERHAVTAIADVRSAMFGSRALMAEEAYDAQAERIAFNRKPKQRPG